MQTLFNFLAFASLAGIVTGGAIIFYFFSWNGGLEDMTDEYAAIVKKAAGSVAFWSGILFPFFLMISYAYLPAVIGAIMGIALIFLGDVERFNPQNPIPSNIGFFLNQAETSKPLYVLVSSLDIFTIWFLILLGIGLATASERKAKGLSVFMIYCGLWLVWVLGKVGLATL